MFGVCAGLWPKRKQLLIGIWVLLTSLILHAQTNTARIKNDGALVYKAASFDAPIVVELEAGNQIYAISSKTVGPFYKIKVKDGVYGYIADTDVEPILTAEQKKKVQKERTKNPERQSKKEDEKKKKRKDFEWENYRGLTFAQINFKEDTMGTTPSANTSFYGFKFSGPQVAWEGSYTDANLLFSFGAPKYYEEATGRSAGGLIMIVDFLWQTEMPQGKNTMTFFGFGPMFKYSKFDLALKVGNKEENYEATDMAVGAAFNLGIAHRFDSFALRGEMQYYWEKVQYMGFALAVQMPF